MNEWQIKYNFAKAFGWDLDYIEKLPIKTTQILIECINIETEKYEAELKKQKLKRKKYG